jgi:ribosomal protein L40E
MADATIRLRAAAHLELGDAKAVVLHIPRELGVCHRCRAKLSQSGTLACTKCRSLNLGW